MFRILGPEAVGLAASIVKDGGVVAYPTDTVYGLACDPWNEKAVVRLFEAKGREGKPIPVICSTLEEAARVVILDGVASELTKRYWPGALTIVGRLNSVTHEVVPRQLDQGTGLVGVRVPNHAFARSFAAQAGGSISGTSANLSNRPSCRTAEEVVESLGDRIEAVIDGGITPGGESTVVRVVDGSIEVLRRGSISIELGTSTRENSDKK